MHKVPYAPVLAMHHLMLLPTSSYNVIIINARTYSKYACLEAVSGTRHRAPVFYNSNHAFGSGNAYKTQSKLRGFSAWVRNRNAKRLQYMSSTHT